MTIEEKDQKNHLSEMCKLTNILGKAKQLLKGQSPEVIQAVKKELDEE